MIPVLHHNAASPRLAASCIDKSASHRQNSSTNTHHFNIAQLKCPQRKKKSSKQKSLAFDASRGFYLLCAASEVCFFLFTAAACRTKSSVSFVIGKCWDWGMEKQQTCKLTLRAKKRGNFSSARCSTDGTSSYFPAAKIYK